ncbi:hypothetical protein [Rubidibacter lacunae]|uniref:hypothetical protein n=1 Tax=Rubidibacter lacunae TaxID=582514 RepID=UPI00040B7C48
MHRQGWPLVARERSLRLAVTKRMVSGESPSWSGFEGTADLLSVIQTCRAQGRSAMEFLVEAAALAARGRSQELSLIPSCDQS